MDKSNTSLSLIKINNVENVTASLNSHALSDIFQSNGTTVKLATKANYSSALTVTDNWAKLDYAARKNENYWEPFYYGTGHSTDYSGSISNGKYYYIYLVVFNSNGSNYKTTISWGVHKISDVYYGTGIANSQYTEGITFSLNGTNYNVRLSIRYGVYSHQEWTVTLQNGLTWKTLCGGDDSTGGVTIHFLEIPWND